MSTHQRVTRGATVWKIAARNGVRYSVSRVRRLGRSEQRKATIDERFAVEAATGIAKELGQMKGVMMKTGQLLGFIIESLPPDAQAALAVLQADAPPLPAGVASAVVRRELGAAPQEIFAEWDEVPVAAASIGQVHRAVTRDGLQVAVKVQYPGIADTLQADLANAEMLYAMFSMFALKGLDAKGLVDELRARMSEELDYRLEATNQAAFVEAYAGHPFFHVPAVLAQFSTERILTTAWVDGFTWAAFVEQADRPAMNRAGEIIWRFAQGSVHELGIFNGDPHPGNYRFDSDGTVTFLDFGLVKRWSPGEWERLSPCLGAIMGRDHVGLIRAMEHVGFLTPNSGLDIDAVADYVSAPYLPYLTDRFTFTRQFMKDTIATISDLRGPAKQVVEQLNLPPSFVILDRLVWGVSALLGKLEVEGPWRAMLDEYRHGGPPSTPLGEEHAAWRLSNPTAPRGLFNASTTI